MAAHIGKWYFADTQIFSSKPIYTKVAQAYMKLSINKNDNSHLMVFQMNVLNQV